MIESGSQVKKVLDYTIDTLPDNIDELSDIVKQMEADQTKGLKIDLQLFAAAKEKLSKAFKETAKRAEAATISRQATQGVEAATLPKPSNEVVLESAKEKKTLKSVFSKAYTRFVDTQKPITDFSKKAGDSTGILASNTRNTSGTVDFILKDGLVNKRGNKIGGSLREVAEKIPKGKEESFWNYMAQRHNIDRAREGKNVIANYTSEMSASAMTEIEKANPAFKKIGDEVTSWIDQFMREWGVDSGLIEEGVYKNLREIYPSYFPTQREFSQLEKSIPDSVRKQFVDVQSPLSKAKGSERDITNPLENIMNLVNRTVKSARYNSVGQSLLDSVRKSPAKLKEFAEVLSVKEGMFSNLDNVVTVMESGKPVYLKINNKELLDAMNGLPKVVNNAKAMRAVTNVFKGLITQKNPLFAIRNMFRDIPTAYIYGSENNPIKFAKDLVSAGKDVATNSKNLQKYKAMGGGMGGFFSPANADKAAKALLKKPNLLQRAGSAIENLNMATETAPRLAEFKRILDKTADVQEALNAANNVTVNFARGGDITKSLEPFVPYLNAGVQGLDRFFKGFKDTKTALATLAKGGIAITLPEVGLYLLNKDDPNYQELDNRTKDTYYLIPRGDGKFIKIPKSRELGVLFGALFQRIMRAAEGEKDSFKDFGTTAATNFMPNNPVENNIGAPLLINLAKNKDFAGRSIVPLGMTMDKRSKYLQYDEKTTEIAKLIGKAAADATGGEGLSPKQIDYIIKSYTGIVGQIGLPLATKGGEPGKAITNSFVADPLYSNKSMQEFYENLETAQRKAKDKNLVENIASKTLTPEEKISNSLGKTSDQLSELSKISARVQSGNVTKEDKTALKKYGLNTELLSKDEIIKRIKQKQIELAKTASEYYKNNK